MGETRLEPSQEPGQGSTCQPSCSLGRFPLSSPQLDELPGWSSMTLWESLSAKGAGKL